MKNRDFHWQLRKLTVGGQRLTVGRLAAAIKVNRSSLNEVLNNKAGRGAGTRPKVVIYLRRELPAQCDALLEALGWDEVGNIKEK